MSKAPATPPAAAEAASEGTKKKSRKKLVLIGVPLLLVVLVAGLWFSGILPGLLASGHAAKGAAAHKDEAKTAAAAPIYVEMPEIVANLDAGPRRASFVKMKPKLEIAQAADQQAITAAMPRLLDLFTTYLREMRPDELRGSAGTYRLREELIARANIATTPARVVDVLFTEMIVQ